MITKLPGVTTSIFSVMSKMAADYNAINLSQGFPNFASNPILIDAVSKAMHDGFNQYAPMQGTYDLRVQISEKIRKLHGKTYRPESEITVTAGATQAIFTALTATIHAGDEVIIFTPAYDSYEPSVRLSGGIAVPVQLRAPDYAPEWDEVRSKITARTRMIMINSPHNPSGMLFAEKDMLQLQEISEQNDLLVLSDEVYEHIIFDGQVHQSAARFEALAERTFITASFGKTFHNTGWKMGYCVGPERLMIEFNKVHQYNVFSVNHPMQQALAYYLQDERNYLDIPKFYEQKRDFFLSLLKNSRFTIIPSKGTYFQLLDFSTISDEGDVAFAERLTKELGVATIPTSVFNENHEDFKQIRVCFAKTEETLVAASKILNAI